MADDLVLPMHSPPADGEVVAPTATDTDGYVPPEINAQLVDSAEEGSVTESPPPDTAANVSAENVGTAPSEFDVVTGHTSRLHEFCTDRRKVGAATGVVLVCVAVLVLMLASTSGSKSDGAGAVLLSTVPLQHHQSTSRKIEEFHAGGKAVDMTYSASLASSNDFELAMAALGSKLYSGGRVHSGSTTLAKYHRGLNNNHHLHCDATSSSEPLQAKTVALPPSLLDRIADLPTEKDWATEMNPAKNQESCGSCWAFATNALVEFAIGAKGRGVVNPAELLDRSEHMDAFAGSDDDFCRFGADAVGRKCGGTGGCEGLTTLAGLSMLKCGPGSVHLWPDKRAEEMMYDEYYHCIQGENSCRYANDGECDDGSQGGTQYCAVGTDTNDCTAPVATKGSDTCRYAFDHECDDGSQGGAQYCDADTDTTDCAETQLAARESKCDFQRAVRKLKEPVGSVSLDKYEIVEVDAFVDQTGERCDMNRDGNECYPNVHGMMAALQRGPIAVGVDASPLQHYRPGGSPTRSRTAYVVSADAAKCSTMCGDDETCLQECSVVASKAATAQQTPTVDHAVVIVGYGNDELGGPYWKIRNSWSESYGESGYVRVERATAEVPCGVDTRLQDGNGCKTDEDGVAIAAECSARYCGAMGVISPGLVQFLSPTSPQFQR